MVREIYTRSENDPTYDPTILEHNNAIETILSQIRLILGTRPGEVLGDNDFGVSIEDLIFATSFNKDRIEEMIITQIYKYISYTNVYNIGVNVSFFKSNDGGDNGLIDITINKVRVQGFLID